MSSFEERRIDSGGERLAARHHPATGEELTGPGGRPCVVMAHGLAATRDCGLDDFAAALAAAGTDVLAFDYRGFADSTGEPRQRADPRGQLADYHAAIAAARALPGVDPARIVAWGVSFAGGHVFRVAAEDGRLACVIALTPAPDGRASLLSALRQDGLIHGLRLTVLGLRDAAAALRGRPPVLAPVVGHPGDLAALTAPGAYEAYLAMAGPSWRNELAARVFLQIGSYRPGTRAGDVTCPVLVQVADEDRTAPPAAAMAAAEAAGAQVHHYRCDHFDVYPGAAWHGAVVAHQVAFLRRHLAVAALPAPVGG